nr:peptidoglycan-binding domain-containing protein [uncultured Cohaesibacter sp.]
MQLSLEPGAEAGYLVNVPLPRQMKASSRSCIAFFPMEPMAATRSTPIMAAIQLGLSRMGYQPGRADGIDGPKTQNAIASFLQQQRLEAPGNNEQLFEMLYQYPFRKLARLGISDKTNCIRIALAKPASPVYRARQPAPVMRQDIRPQNRNTREEAIGRVLGMGLAIGILNNGYSREPRRPRYNGPME